eukprot:scaffold261_cov336-Pavlova_lutheri.AAC.38
MHMDINRTARNSVIPLVEDLGQTFAPNPGKPCLPPHVNDRLKAFPRRSSKAVLLLEVGCETGLFPRPARMGAPEDPILSSKVESGNAKIGAWSTSSP